MGACQQKVNFAGFLFIHRKGTFCELTLFKNTITTKIQPPLQKISSLGILLSFKKRRNWTQILTSSLARRAESLEPTAPMTRFISCEIVELKLEDWGAQPAFRVVIIRTLKTPGWEPAYRGSDLIYPSGACVSVRSFHAGVVSPLNSQPLYGCFASVLFFLSSLSFHQMHHGAGEACPVCSTKPTPLCLLPSLLTAMFGKNPVFIQDS